jgi:hypothetical protein
MIVSQQPALTVIAVATHFGVQPWQVRRLYERGFLPPAPRAGLYRLILSKDLPKVQEALQRAGYLKDEVGHAAS